MDLNGKVKKLCFEFSSNFNIYVFLNTTPYVLFEIREQLLSLTVNNLTWLIPTVPIILFRKKKKKVIFPLAVLVQFPKTALKKSFVLSYQEWVNFTSFSKNDGMISNISFQNLHILQRRHHLSEKNGKLHCIGQRLFLNPCCLFKLGMTKVKL